MDGYATLNGKQFEIALERAIDTLEAKVKADEIERLTKTEEIWEARTWYFGPWNRKGAEARYWDWVGFGSYEISERERLLKDYQTQLLRIDVMNAEPYLLKMRDFNKLMSWQQ